MNIKKIKRCLKRLRPGDMVSHISHTSGYILHSPSSFLTVKEIYEDRIRYVDGWADSIENIIKYIVDGVIKTKIKKIGYK